MKRTIIILSLLATIYGAVAIDEVDVRQRDADHSWSPLPEGYLSIPWTRLRGVVRRRCSIKGGPWKFGGLPGCILKVYDTKKIYVWEAVAIERGKFQITQYPDKLYPKASRNRIYKLQTRYNDDYYQAIGWTSLEGRPTPGKVPFEPLEKE